jgi:quercetin dioxygenase-like cupin family protein
MPKFVSPHFLLAAMFILFLPVSLQGADVKVLFAQELKDIAGKTGQVLTVDYKPGESSAQHRHNAHTFV